MSDYARLMLVGGPFDGHEAARLATDLTPPVQISWAGIVNGRFEAWLYEWRGEMSWAAPTGRVASLNYHPVRQVAPADIPPAVAEAVALWADGADLIASVSGARWQL